MVVVADKRSEPRRARKERGEAVCFLFDVSSALGWSEEARGWLVAKACSSSFVNAKVTVDLTQTSAFSIAQKTLNGSLRH